MQDIADTLSDPLTLLRRFTMTKQPVKLVGDYLVFGRVRFSRAAPTAYRWTDCVDARYAVGKPFYPVDALWFLLQKQSLKPGEYLRECTSNQMMPVSRPDQRALLAYLNGTADSSPAIDMTGATIVTAEPVPADEGATSAAAPTASSAGGKRALEMAQQQLNVTCRRQQKAAAALSEDGFALHPLDEIEDSALWQSLAQFLRTSDAAQLGKGKDVTRSFGEYNALRLASAWRVEHPRARRRYDAAKEDIIEDMTLLDRKGVHALGTLPRGLPVACMPSKPCNWFRLDTRRLGGVLLARHQRPCATLLAQERPQRALQREQNWDRFWRRHLLLFAEDVAKSDADQYSAPDVGYDKSCDLHRRLYGKSYRHKGSVFYVLVCRVLLGYPARTLESGKGSTHMDMETGEPLFPHTFRELAHIPNVSPPMQ